MTGEIFAGKLGLQQRVLPSYRAVFLDTLASACQEGLSVFAGLPLPVEGIEPVNDLRMAHLVKVKNRNIGTPSSPFYMCWQPGFLDWLESWQPDALIVEANPRYPTSRQAIRWMHAHNRKVIGWGLGAPALSGLMAGLRGRQRLELLRSLDAVIAYSSQGAQQYRLLGIPKNRVFIAYNAVDRAPTSLPAHKSDPTLGKATVLFVGRLQARKRVDMLLEACSSLPDSLQPHLVIVGDGPEKTKLEEMAAQAYPKAEFLGARYGSELIPFLDQADLFVLPGTGGLAIQQAMAHALPVVVAQGDGTQDDLVRVENGWQVPPGNLPALTNVLQQALSNLPRLREMGAASYRIVAEEINVDAMVRVFVQVLNNL